MFEKIWTFIRHYQATSLSALLVIAVLIYAYGCQSRVISILNAPNLVNRGQLQIEVDTFIAQAELKFSDLNTQDQVKSYLFNTVIDFAQGGNINPLAVAVILGNILGLGAVIDNRRKDGIITTLKSR